MDEELLAGRFEANRARLRGMAYRMLGSAGDADDAVQESWLRAARAGADDVRNLDGWLTTITARVCLDMLRSRRARREEPAGGAEADFELAAMAGADPGAAAARGPEQEAMLAESVGVALLVVLDRLGPAERVAFVLHDMFGIPFGEIAQITGRSADGARQLASRARRRVQGAAGQDADAGPAGEPGSTAGARPLSRPPASQRAAAEAFIAASRTGDLEALLAVLDPDVVLRADAAATPAGRPAELHGAAAVAHGARLAAGRSRDSALALVDGAPGIVYAPGGQVTVVLAFGYQADRITSIEVIGEPARLAALELAVLD